jgi:hypothetical protein
LNFGDRAASSPGNRKIEKAASNIGRGFFIGLSPAGQPTKGPAAFYRLCRPVAPAASLNAV